MSELETFERIVALLYDAMLDDRNWPAASALIDEACGAKGNALLFVEGSEEDMRAHSVGFFQRGTSRGDLEREYMEIYHPIDERVSRFRELPFGRLVSVAELYDEEERKCSPTYNEFMLRADGRDGLNVRLAGSDDCRHVAWVIGDPVDSREWRSDRIAMVERLHPFVCHFVHVRRALARAKGLEGSLDDLLDNLRVGVLHLDRSGRIMAANDRARSILEVGDGLWGRNRFLHARLPEEDVRLSQILADALVDAGSAPVGGSMAVTRCAAAASFVVHVRPTVPRDFDFGGRGVGALVLVVAPERQARIDQDLVAAALGLTPSESQIAVSLAEGRTVRDIAEGSGRRQSSIYWHLRQIYAKHGISRQPDLVRLVLSVTSLR